MKNKIYYLTRSYSPYQKGGGPLMRTGAVKYLKKLGWNVIVIVPNYQDKELNEVSDVWQIPFNSNHIQKLSSLLERIGFYEDYLDKWVDNTFSYLKNVVKKDDIVFATSGGELGMIKLGSLLKNQIGCKFVVNFRDPLNYGYMKGLRRDNKFHVGREKAHQKYLLNADLILTSSIFYANVLTNRFPFLENNTYNNYFGYIKKIDTSKYKKVESKKLRIAYAGIMSSTQKPELLYQAYKKLNVDIEIYFIGNRNNYKPLQNIDDESIHFIDFLPHEDFLKFMSVNIDVGFVSLVNDYYGACVPSKIYEYINLELPILGALPEGDAMNIINSYSFGLASNYNKLDDLVGNITTLLNKEKLLKIKKNLSRKKDDFSMDRKIKEVDNLLRNIYEK